MSVDTKYGEAIFKQTQEVAEMFKAAMPKITTNKKSTKKTGNKTQTTWYLGHTLFEHFGFFKSHIDIDNIFPG